jgi:integral membrane protein
MNHSLLVKIFRVLGWFEGGSFLLLMFVGMPLKYLMGNPFAVKLLGMPHGILFIAYVLLANIIAEELNWSLKVRMYAFLAAVLPFGTFIFEHKFLKSDKNVNRP